MVIKGINLADSPREKIIEHGVETLQDYELLALILCNGTKQQDVLTLSRSILLNWNLDEIFKSDISKLVNINGIGIARAAQIRAIGRIFELIDDSHGFNVSGKKQSKNRASKKTQLKGKLNDKNQLKTQNSNSFFSVKNTKKVIEIIKKRYVEFYKNVKNSKIDNECLIAIYLDHNMNFINSSFMTSHMKNKIFVPNSYLLKESILNRASYVILVHNHLKDKLQFSRNDKSCHKKINDILAKIEVKLLDYVILNRNGYISIRNEG